VGNPPIAPTILPCRAHFEPLPEPHTLFLETMTAVFIDTPFLKVHVAGNYPFLIIEPMGNLQLADYQTQLSDPKILEVIGHLNVQMVYLELNGIWTIGMDQQEWTVTTFQASLQSKGISKMAIGLAEHVYPTFSMLASSYEKMAILPTKYFPDLDQMTQFLR
jgi:hypothetical protein